MFIHGQTLGLQKYVYVINLLLKLFRIGFMSSIDPNGAVFEKSNRPLIKDSVALVRGLRPRRGKLV